MTCRHGCENPHQCLSCVSEKMTDNLLAGIREQSALFRKAPVHPVSNLPPALSDPCAGKPLTKPELLFVNGYDAIIGLNGELFTAVCGRWIRTQ